MKTIDELMLLIDAYADASFEQGSDHLENDTEPTKARAAVVAALREALTERKPLTDEQLDAILVVWPDNLGSKAFARAIEAAHGIKETS